MIANPKTFMIILTRGSTTETKLKLRTYSTAFNLRIHNVFCTSTSPHYICTRNQKRSLRVLFMYPIEQFTKHKETLSKQIRISLLHTTVYFLRVGF